MCLVKSAVFNDHMLHVLHMLNIKKVIRLYYNPAYLKILCTTHNSLNTEENQPLRFSNLEVLVRVLWAADTKMGLNVRDDYWGTAYEE